MSDDSGIRRRPPSSSLSEEVGRRAQRKIRARRHSSRTVWLGLGMMGLIGWSVAVPTLCGAALGLWLDHHHPGKHAWTLAFLAAGLAIGCLTAWHWVAGEERVIREEQEQHDD